MSVGMEIFGYCPGFFGSCPQMMHTVLPNFTEWIKHGSLSVNDLLSAVCAMTDTDTGMDYLPSFFIIAWTFQEV
jgi:hypothetical protein